MEGIAINLDIFPISTNILLFKVLSTEKIIIIFIKFSLPVAQRLGLPSR